MNAIRERGGTIAIGSGPQGRDSTLGLLAAHGHDLLLACRSCEHWRSMPIEEAVVFLRLGARTEFGAIKARCTRCGSRSVIARSEVRLATSGAEHPSDLMLSLDSALAF